MKSYEITIAGHFIGKTRAGALKQPDTALCIAHKCHPCTQVANAAWISGKWKRETPALAESQLVLPQLPLTYGCHPGKSAPHQDSESRSLFHSPGTPLLTSGGCRNEEIDGKHPGSCCVDRNASKLQGPLCSTSCQLPVDTHPPVS